MSTHTLNIVGITTGIDPTAGPPPRRSIFDVVKDTKAFSLYIQALTQLSAQNQSTVSSAFQLGGIHGMPYVEWDGSGSKTASREWEGYCTHGSVLFPTWHRPYVAVYEQLLQSLVIQIASTYTTTPDASAWQAAAQTWRLPYWDWAQNSVPPNEIISEPTVSIVNNTGATVSVTNPVYSYAFHPVSDGKFPAPFSRWKGTLRCPDSESANAQTDVQTLISNLTGPNDSTAYQIQQSTYVLLSTISSWINMSNHSSDINTDYASSLESIHDNIHVDVGGDNGGHMADPAVAAFDPIFFLHHANVDRLLSLWQALNPDNFVTSSTSEQGTWAIQANATVDASTSLAPFWENNTTYWSSNNVRSWTTFGYTYPEFVGQDLSNPDALKSYISNVVNQLYGGGFLPSGSGGGGDGDGDGGDGNNTAASGLAPVSAVAKPPAAAATATPAPAPAAAAISHPVSLEPGIEIPPNPAHPAPVHPAEIKPVSLEPGLELPPAGISTLPPITHTTPLPSHNNHSAVERIVNPVSLEPGLEVPPAGVLPPVTGAGAGGKGTTPPHLGPGPVKLPPGTVPTQPAQPPQHSNPPHLGPGPVVPPTTMPHLGPGPVVTPHNMPHPPHLGPGPVKLPHPQFGHLIDWRAHIETPKFALGGSYSVLIFIGDVPTDPTQWKTSPTFVGSRGIFANSVPQACPNCQRHADILIEGVVHLNQALERAKLSSYKPEVVVPYLKDNLHWRVLQKGREIDIAEQLPELKVTVLHAPIHRSENDDLPHRIGDIIKHIGITHGRVGGAGHPADPQ